MEAQLRLTPETYKWVYLHTQTKNVALALQLKANGYYVVLQLV